MKLPSLQVRMSLQSRFMVSVGMLLVLLTAIITVAVNNRLASLMLRETRGRGLAIAQSIGATTTNALLNYDYVSLSQAAQKSVQEGRQKGRLAYVIILDKEGNEAARSERSDFAGMVGHESVSSNATEATEPLLQSTQVLVREMALSVLDVAYPVYLDGGSVKWGTIRVGIDLQPMYQELNRVRWILILIGAIAGVLALLGARFISRRITASIDDLVRGTIAISEGNLDHRMEIDTGDEIATLASHFNHMTAQVKQKQDEIAIAKKELEILNATLEEKVAKRTQEFLASEEKYRILVENSPDPILIVQDGFIRFVNSAFDRVFNYSPGEVVRESLGVASLFHDADRSLALECFARIREEEIGALSEVRGVTKAGEIRLFEMRGMRINYLGRPAVELILVDTTEKQELQDQLVQHEKLRALGELAGGVAHDFNNILGVILGRAQLLQRQVRDEGVLRGLRTIEKAAFDGGETVRRIQDFARSRTERDFEDVDLNMLLEDSVEITRTRWKNEAELRNAKIDVTIESAPVANIRGNASELREVLTNLIFNAVDAMPEGGHIYLKSAMDGDEVVLEVQDTGLGMDEKVRARIFDPFFTTKGSQGLGLGMSVVYGIIERHNGKISVESQLGHGTCFTIRIPAAAPRADARSEEVPVVGQRSARILVIDDEAEILELVAEILTEGGYTVVTAQSGPEGLEHLDSGEFDLLFCDLGMREMSGWDVVTVARERVPNLVVILLTGWGATLSEEKVREHKIDAVLNKPFEMSKMLHTVMTLLEKKEQETSLAG